MSAYGRAVLLLALDAATDARAEELAPTLFADARTEGDLAWWSSDGDPLLGDAVDTTVEATALAVQGLARRDTDHPTVERAVRWLLANRASGSYWGTTKQTAMALYGLLALVEARREEPATFSVDVVVNGEVVGTHTFVPESWAAPEPVRVRAAARVGDNDIRLVKRGAGPLYWSATARYFETQEPIERTGSRRLAIAREYFALAQATERGHIVYRPRPFEGRAQQGDLLLVRVTVAGSTDWRFLVMDDPIPAGMEAVRDPTLVDIDPGVSWWNGSRREYRDSRVIQFQESFERGRYEYHYLLKAVTPGVYRAMPAQIAPMYVPGVAASTTMQAVTILGSSAPAPAGGNR
jgi:uncharacterized protein YfaS (alpha-2-macroglobulin family)